MDHDLLVALKALSDASRLRIVGLLAARPYAVEELSAALELSPGTVVHHMKRLRAAGLVDANPSDRYRADDAECWSVPAGHGTPELMEAQRPPVYPPPMTGSMTP